MACPKKIVFRQKLLEKNYFIVKMIGTAAGTALVRLANSDFESALSHLRS